MKTRLFLISALAATAALAACDRSETTGAGKDISKATREATKDVAGNVQDTTVTTKVKAALLADEQVKGTQISVETAQGTVTLTGNAESPAQKQRAEQLAMNIDGVRGVNNRIATPQ